MNAKSFTDLGISTPILRSIEEQNFTAPTNIQEQTIPLVIENKDVIGGSKTGSGKTLAFGCGLIQKSEPGKGIQGLVLVPTRELAEQVADSIKKFSKYKKLKVTTVYGGVSINPQIDNLRKADIVIGTPGRILDHIGRRTIKLSGVNTLVLDEADMMLDMGFLPDVEKIIREIPKERQTLLFSATISTDLNSLTRKHMHDPVKISAEEFVDTSKLKQIYYNVPNNQKFALMVHLLKEDKEGLVMIFCNTRRNSDFVGKNLKLNGIKNSVIHGGLTQAKRSQILAEFHKGKVYVLICTDVAARGLDISGVSHVYNYDTCADAKQYIHRIGRTARAGQNGMAVTLLSERDHQNFSKVYDQYRGMIKLEDMPKVERVKIQVDQRRPRYEKPRFGAQKSTSRRRRY